MPTEVKEILMAALDYAFANHSITDSEHLTAYVYLEEN